MPSLPPDKISRAQVTRLASESHVNTVEEGNDSAGKYYRLLRQRLNKDTDGKTDVGAIEQGNISITPLYTNLPGKPSPSTLDNLCAGLLKELQKT